MGVGAGVGGRITESTVKLNISSSMQIAPPFFGLASTRKFVRNVVMFSTQKSKLPSTSRMLVLSPGAKNRAGNWSNSSLVSPSRVRSTDMI